MLKAINLIGALWFQVWMPGFMALAMWETMTCHNLVCGAI